jgi:O-antigen ligase
VVKYGLPATTAAVVPALLLFPVIAAFLRRERMVASPMFGLLILYFAVQIASTAQAFDIGWSLTKLLTFGIEGLFIYFAVTNAIRSRVELERASITLLISASFLGLLTLIQGVTHHYYGSYGGFARVSPDFLYGFDTSPRLQGPIGDPNYFAQVMLIAVPLGLLVASSASTRWGRIGGWTAGALALSGIVLSYSRGAILALLVVLLAMVLLRQVSFRQLVAVITALVLVVFAVPSYHERVNSLVSASNATAAQGAGNVDDQSVRARSTEMKAALLAYIDHPVLGVGPGAFPLNYQRYAGEVGGEVHDTVKFGPNKGTIPERQAHDLFLGLAAEIGSLGIGVLITLLVTTEVLLLRTRRGALVRGDKRMAALATAYFLSIIAYLTAGIFLSLAYERYMWLLLALAAATIRVGAIENRRAGRSTTGNGARR